MHDTIPHEHAPSGHAHDHAQDDRHDHDHAEGAPHDHDHPEAGPLALGHDAPLALAPEQAPQNVENLILDIGADTGALIIHAAIDRDQAEVEISPAGSEPATRTHNIVRRREAVGGAVYAAVFPALTAGDYVVWRDTATPAGTVTVQGGRVASFRLN